MGKKTNNHIYWLDTHPECTPEYRFITTWQLGEQHIIATTEIDIPATSFLQPSQAIELCELWQWACLQAIMRSGSGEIKSVMAKYKTLMQIVS